MEANYIREKITDLRLQKGVSEHRMSLDLGHARSYIHGIVSGKVLPSMTEFLYICDYLGVTPAQFFSTEEQVTLEMAEIIKECSRFTREDQQFILSLLKKLK